jgi:hypothetical protein
MAKQLTVIGHNVKGMVNGSELTLKINLDHSLGQTKGSTKPGKLPNEMVGTTKTYAPVPDSGGCKLMLHLIRPMDDQQVKQAKALRELDEEDATTGETQITPELLQKIIASLNGGE